MTSSSSIYYHFLFHSPLASLAKWNYVKMSPLGTSQWRSRLYVFPSQHLMQAVNYSPCVMRYIWFLSPIDVNSCKIPSFQFMPLPKDHFFLKKWTQSMEEICLTHRQIFAWLLASCRRPFLLAHYVHVSGASTLYYMELKKLFYENSQSWRHSREQWHYEADRIPCGNKITIWVVCLFCRVLPMHIVAEWS